MWLLLKIAGALSCASALIVLVAYFGQRQLIYFPDPARVLPGELGLSGVEERLIKTPDGERLVVWYARPSPASRRCSISMAMVVGLKIAASACASF